MKSHNLRVFLCFMFLVAEVVNDQMDCTDDCSENEFKCSDHTCIDIEGVCDQSNDCPDGSDEANCNVTGVRLVDGLGPWEGRVEIAVNGLFGTICNKNWDSKDAAVVCKMLGYRYMGIPTSFLRDGPGRIWMGNVNCRGNETSLDLCGYERERHCRYYPDAGVRCICTENEFNCSDHTCIEGERVCDQSSDCDDGSDEDNCTVTGVRLVDGLGPWEGRVEIAVNGIFGTVCKFGWDSNDAAVVCSMMGYRYWGIPKTHSEFGIGSARIWLNQVDCRGNETSLDLCGHDGFWNHYCFAYYNYAGVRCICTENEFNCSDHTCIDEERVCDQSIDCADGSDEDNCTVTGVRLVDGLGPWEGRVEIAVNGIFGTVCKFGWDSKDAAVVCKMLGYRYWGIPKAQSEFGIGSARVWLNQVDCRGNETSLDLCGHDGFGNHRCSRHYDCAGVRCICTENEFNCSDHTCIEGERVCDNWIDCDDESDEANCTVTEVRLVGGLGHWEGRVEIDVNGLFGTVCDRHWDSRDAAVVCGMLGYRFGGILFLRSKFGMSSGRIWMANVHCRGNGTSLDLCDYDDRYAPCNHYHEAGVRCPQPQLEMTPSVIPPFDVNNTDPNAKVSLMCNVYQDPELSYTPYVVLQGVSNVHLSPYYNTTQCVNSTFHFSFRPTEARDMFLTCVVTYAGLPNITTIRDINMTVYELPTVSLSNCPINADGSSQYIKGKLSSNCMCQMKRPGYPASEVQWIHPNGSVLVSSSSEAVLTYTYLDNYKTFTCRGVSRYGTGENVTFKAKFAYGPTNVTAGPVQILPFQGDQSDFLSEIAMYCDVPVDDVNPYPLVVLKGVTDMDDLVPDSNLTVDDVHRFLFTFTPNNPLNLSVKCVASNHIFPDLTAESEFMHYESPVAELQDCPPLIHGSNHPVMCMTSSTCKCHLTRAGFPPGQARWVDARGNVMNKTQGSLYALLQVDTHHTNQLVNCQTVSPFDIVHSIPFQTEFLLPAPNPPVVTLNDGSHLANDSIQYVLDGSKATLRCTVDGGSPPISTSTLQCGTQQVTAASVTELSTQLDITLSHDQAMCVCRAEYVSDCVENIVTQVKLNVLLWPSITSFTIGRAGSPTASNTPVSFVCEITGNTLPAVTVRGLLTDITVDGQVTQVDSSTWRFTLTKTVTVLDTDTYVCEANIGLAAVNQSFHLVVNGSPVAIIDQSNPVTATSLPNGLIHAEVMVISNPPPVTYALVRRRLKDGNVEVRRFDSDSYNVKFQALNGRTGRVSMNAVDFGFQETDQYVLTIENGISEPTAIVFNNKLQSDPSTLGDSKSFQFLLGIGIADCLAVIGIIACFSAYVIWSLKAPPRSPAQTATRNTMNGRTNRSPRRVTQQSREYRPRLWRERHGY